MKWIAILFVVTAGTAAQPAAASSWLDFGRGYHVQAQRPNPGEAERSSRDGRREPPPGRRQDGRLTDDERRDLRRDIDRANREIYKDKGRR